MRLLQSLFNWSIYLALIPSPLWLVYSKCGLLEFDDEEVLRIDIPVGSYVNAGEKASEPRETSFSTSAENPFCDLQRDMHIRVITCPDMLDFIAFYAAIVLEEKKVHVYQYTFYLRNDLLYALAHFYTSIFRACCKAIMRCMWAKQIFDRFTHFQPMHKNAVPQL